MPLSCKPTRAAAARSTSRKTVKVKGKSKALSIDLHCHIHTDAADAIAQQSATNASPIARYGNPRTEAQQKKLHEDLHKKLTDVDQRIADMDKMDIDVQAISSSPLQYYYGVELRHHGVRRTATGASGESLRRGERSDRHRLPLRHGLLQAGGFRGKSKKLTRAQKDLIIGGNAAKLLGLKKR